LILLCLVCNGAGNKIVSDNEDETVQMRLMILATDKIDDEHKPKIIDGQILTSIVTKLTESLKDSFVQNKTRPS
jgi:hypothetical protein